jgi:hypothetical protein
MAVTANCLRHDKHSVKKSLPTTSDARPRSTFVFLSGEAENNRMPVVSQTSFLYDMSKATFHKQRDRKEKAARQKQLRKLVRVSVHMGGEKGFFTTRSKDVSEIW